MSYPKNERRTRTQYRMQKTNAKLRGISWELTYEQWLQIWTDSGHLHERGRKHGQFCMARNGDVGPYAAENVKIITVGENIGEHAFGNTYALGYKHTEKTKSRLSAIHKGNRYCLGKRHTDTTKKRMSEAKKGKPKPIGFGAKISAAMTGKNNPMFGRIPSNETREKIGDTLRGKPKSATHKKNIRLGWIKRKKSTDWIRRHN